MINKNKNGPRFFDFRRTDINAVEDVFVAVFVDDDDDGAV